MVSAGSAAGAAQRCGGCFEGSTAYPAIQRPGSRWSVGQLGELTDSPDSARAAAAAVGHA